MEVLPDLYLDEARYGVVPLLAPFCIKHKPTHVAQFVVMRRGSCWFECPENQTEPLFVPEGGILGTVGEAEQIWRSSLSIADDTASSQLIVTPAESFGGEGAQEADVLMFTGQTPISSNILFPAFPPVFLVPPTEVETISQFNVMLDFVESNAIHPDALEREGLIRRASEIMTIILMRFLKGQLSETNPGWPNIAMDSQVMKAINLIESEPTRKWTIKSLATEIGMSRSAFAARFKALVGDTPANYLARIRMRQATILLREGQRSVGYESELGFVKAFGRQFGTTPAQYRTRIRKAIS